MIPVTNQTNNNDIDAHVDGEIRTYLNLDTPKSFFMFAGAGSGKTRSLVKALEELRIQYGRRMRLRGQYVGVITYTNAACDEIKKRLGFDPLLVVKTIHSFVWDLISGFNNDIRAWLQVALGESIRELQEKQRKGREGTQASTDRARSIKVMQDRLNSLGGVRKFTYNPNGDNQERDSLNHSEVIKIGAAFLTHKPLMRRILIRKYPILLIDESQDTNKLLMEAFLAVEREHRGTFCLGLFGDTMQRIYSDGKLDLGQNLPDWWMKPAKVMNHRCPRRIVRLINKIREAVDGQEQQTRIDAKEGNLRLFVTLSGKGNSSQIESEARKQMATITGDSQWADSSKIKTLTLEHSMAAVRMGFFEIFKPLYQIDSFKTGLRDGTLPVLRFFSELLLPVVEAIRRHDQYAVAALLRNTSPLLSKVALQGTKGNQAAQIGLAKQAVQKLTALFDGGTEPLCVDVLRCVAAAKLFDIPDDLLPFSSGELAHNNSDSLGSRTVSDEKPIEPLAAVRMFLQAPFSQVGLYTAYVRGKAAFGTHQGVKGLEFPRVMVVMDDVEAGGFLFSYEKLLGVKEKTNTDLENERVGAETGIDRTRRLFYVTCSRTQDSLALIAYSSDPGKVRQHAISQGWLHDKEIIEL